MGQHNNRLTDGETDINMADPILRAGQMMAGDQSRKDVPSQRVDLLSPKNTIRIGCWNVRTLYQTGKVAQALSEMKSYKLNMLVVTEGRWTDWGK